MPKKLRQTFTYLENEKSFWDELKSIIHYFWRAIAEAKKIFFLEIESPTLIRMLYLKNQIFRGVNNIFLEIP